MAPNAVDLLDLKFSYDGTKTVLDIPALSVARGERVFLHGPSGSGKTTLLGLIGGVLVARHGKVEILGKNLSQLSVHDRDLFRGSHVGYIFQMFNLIPYLTVAENIILPCVVSPERRARLGGADPLELAAKAADRLGLTPHFHDKVTNLSVGQQQRVAAIRAMMGRPELVIADEPTSSLDSDRREEFIQMLFELCDENQATLVFVSHDHALKPLFTRHISLREVNQVKS